MKIKYFGDQLENARRSRFQSALEYPERIEIAMDFMYEELTRRANRKVIS